MMVSPLLAVSFLVLVMIIHCGYTSNHRGEVKYSDSFAVKVHGGLDVAKDVANACGLLSLGKIGNLRGVYLFKLSGSEEDREYAVAKNTSSHSAVNLLRRDRRVGFILRQKLLQREKRYSPPTDPRWTRQWSLFNTGQVGGSPGRDLNVQPVWMQGITGRGVVVAVVDDGILHTHPDLVDNFDQNGSYDFVDNDNNVAPGYSQGERDNHGTSCAGEIAMAKDNSICGVGVAYEAKIADAAEASSLGYKMDYIDIYSNSWGPFDNGILVEGPGPLLKAVLKKGTRMGRGGKGSIYVWAAGNGGHRGDSCATDGYASSIYTIAVGAANQYGTPAYYDETCTSKMAVTFSHNTETLKQNQIITTDAEGTCRDDFMGTSAACPLVSGTIALALQANPTLTWRDVQYLIVYTSDYLPLQYRSYWNRNGAGLWISQKFGFGAINAEALVSRARNWISVPKGISYTFQPPLPSSNATNENLLVINFHIGGAENPIRFLEHVKVEVSLTLGGYNQHYSYYDYVSLSSYLGIFFTQEDLDDLLHHDDARRGDIAITLVSPQGTRSELLPYRDRDFVNTEGFDIWPLMSVLHWSEDPQGLWSLTVSYRSRIGYVHVDNISVTFYGTEQTPTAVRMIPEQCDSACLGSCAASGPQFCDSCKSFRNASTLECITDCMGGQQQFNDYCIDPLANTSYIYTPPMLPEVMSTPVSSVAPLQQIQPKTPGHVTFGSVTPAYRHIESPSLTTSGHHPVTTMPIQTPKPFPSGSLVDPSCASVWPLSTPLPRPTLPSSSSSGGHDIRHSASPPLPFCSRSSNLSLNTCIMLLVIVLHNFIMTFL